MAIDLDASGVPEAYFWMFSSTGVVFPAPPGDQKQHRNGACLTVLDPAPQHRKQHSPHKIRHCKQHRKGKIQPQSSTITGTVTVPVVN
ncbi:hypothetical protein ITP74_004577 [Salmonella enterica subsp. enterica serovar Give]|nr:hypothetical protein [Salmonella enterica subsp. enterica serovar Give]EIS1038605.1 hypothetical protein [Salmonella enterica]